MTANLPPQLLRLFAPRPLLPYATPLLPEPEKRKKALITGLFQVIERIHGHDVDYVPTETLSDRKKRLV